jgi:hypothetical protein
MSRTLFPSSIENRYGRKSSQRGALSCGWFGVRASARTGPADRHPSSSHVALRRDHGRALHLSGGRRGRTAARCGRAQRRRAAPHRMSVFGPPSPGSRPAVIHPKSLLAGPGWARSSYTPAAPRSTQCQGASGSTMNRCWPCLSRVRQAAARRRLAAARGRCRPACG